MKRKLFHINTYVLRVRPYSKTLLGFGYFYSFKSLAQNNRTNHKIQFCIGINKIWKGTHKTLIIASVEEAEIETNR